MVKLAKLLKELIPKLYEYPLVPEEENAQKRIDSHTQKPGQSLTHIHYNSYNFDFLLSVNSGVAEHW